MDIFYRPVTREDVEPIIALVHEHLTQGDYVADCIRQASDRGTYFGFKAEDETGRMRGFATIVPGFEFTLPHPELEREIGAKFPPEEIMTGDAFYVDSACRRMGIGSRFIQLTRREMLRRGGKYFLGEVWVYPDKKMPSKNVDYGFGDVVLEEYVPGFYKDLGKFGMKCPVCGENCKCDALIQLIRLKEDKEDGQDEQ